MKQYTSRELSEKLVKLGCKSQSGFYYNIAIGYQDIQKPFHESELRILGWIYPHRDLIPAFEFEDFCGTHEQVKDNLHKVSLAVAALWHEIYDGMLKSSDWIKYLEKVMEER